MRYTKNMIFDMQRIRMLHLAISKLKISEKAIRRPIHKIKTSNV